MDFEKLPVVLKRYEFAAKMNIAQKHSIDIMTVNGIVSTEELIGKALPWELETFALISVSTINEYDNQDFGSKKGGKNFSKMITSIRNYQHPALHSSDQDNKFLDHFMIVTGLTQFQIQENLYYKIYRYKYIFNFKNEEIDMVKEFKEKFGTKYKEFLNLGLFINFICGGKIKDPRIFQYTLIKYMHVIKHLVRERESFIKLQSNVTEDTKQFLYGFKYFYHYPFISYQRTIYLPLPHLLMQTVTSSLLFRLTENNSKLRSDFGKEVLENYILHICNLSGQFEELIPEYLYKYKKNEKRTLDVMIRKGEYCFMIDSKSMSPKVSLRDLSVEDMEYTLNRLAESVVQVYRHVTERLFKEYYPFTKKVQFLPENIFGAVIIFEDSFIRREVIMKRAAEVLNLEPGSENFEYLCSNIKVVNLNSMERMVFENQDISENFIKGRDSKTEWFSYTLARDQVEGDEKVIREIELVSEEIQETLKEFINDLISTGLVNRSLNSEKTN